MIKFVGDNFESQIKNLRLYSDGTPMVKVEDFNDIVEYADTIVVKADNLQTFITAMFLVDSIHISGGNIHTLVLPYIPGARQDRINPTGDVLFTLSSVASMINNRFFDTVLALDPHSHSSFNLISNLVDYPLELVAEKVWNGYGGIIAPDKGAVYRAQEFDIHSKGVTYGSKHRDVATGKLSGFGIDVEAGKHYLIVDDICDGGGTFIGLNEKIKEQGAFAHLYVSHGIFSKGLLTLLDEFGTVYTTDTRPKYEGSYRDNYIVIPVVDDMVNYARGI
jgi:ribose-phosphate pyrophosphokinase